MSTTTLPATKPAVRTRALVLYDGHCRFCQRSVAILRRLDWLGYLEYQSAREEEGIPPRDPPLDRARLLEEMHLITPDQKHVYHGFDCFRWMAWRLPLLLPIAPLLYIPGVPELGQRIYLWIARNRFKIIPCEHGMCHLP